VRHYGETIRQGRQRREQVQAQIDALLNAPEQVNLEKAAQVH
jgi:hypothetical protein